MASTAEELGELFAPSGDSMLPPDIMGELQSIIRLHSMPPQELFYKWESYSIKMGSEETKLDLDTARAFKKDVQENLERETRGKAHLRSVDKRGIHSTPRNTAAKEDVFGMMDGLISTTPRTGSINGGTKRKAAFETPTIPKIAKARDTSTPSDGRTAMHGCNGNTNDLQMVPFADRQNAGQVIETLNEHLNPHEPPVAPPSEPRVKLTAYTDIKKFSYKPMAMHLSEASEVLDDRIDEFMTLVQTHHSLEDSIFGNPAMKSTSEIVALGRIASDTSEGKLNAASMVLETSRRMGAGLRVPMKIDSIASYEFFPGQIVAVRGINASGDYFSISEVLEVPLLPPAASLPSTLDAINERLGVSEDENSLSVPAGLNIMMASGPYTADNNLAFEPLHILCEKANETSADVLLLIGPIFDIEHPLIASGDFDVPEDSSFLPDKATLSDVFRILVGVPLRRLAQAVPGITIILVPSVRDALNKHVSWPQEPYAKKELGLPKQARMVTNPVTVSINEMVIGISAQDILYDLRREEVVVGKAKEGNILARLPRHLIQQRHFFPMFPPVNRSLLPKAGTEEGVATGMPLDISYLKLGEWLNVRPDVLISPSALSPFAKVVDSVLVINPGTLSKRKGPGTYTQMAVYPRKITDEERTAEQSGGMFIDHRIFERARVDIIRI